MFITMLKTWRLVLAATVWCLATANFGQGQKRADVPLARQAEGTNGQTQKRADEILRSLRRDEVRETDFIAGFRRLTPEAQVSLWEEGTNSANTDSRMEQILIANGPQAAHYVAVIVRTGESQKRLLALKLLCDMDRFIPASFLLIPESGEYDEPTAAGLRNRFMIVDGRRIGQEAYASIKWAAEQNEDQDLRFHAREYSGLLDQDLRRISLSEQIQQWREAVSKSRGVLGLHSDAFTLASHLGRLLVEAAPESLPPLIGILANESNGYVREEAVDVVHLIDIHCMRLRGTDIGRKAIEAVHAAIERGGLKPVYTNRESRERLWKHISDEVFNDAHTQDAFSNWDFYGFALYRFYGANTVDPPRAYSGEAGSVPKAAPEMREFASYLTEIDPYYPSWEYVHVGVGYDEVLNPLFKKKMARYYEKWTRFEALHHSAVSPKPE